MEEFRSACYCKRRQKWHAQNNNAQPTRRETINNNNNNAASRKNQHSFTNERPCSHSRSSDRSKPTNCSLVIFYCKKKSHTREGVTHSHCLLSVTGITDFFPPECVRSSVRVTVESQFFFSSLAPFEDRTQGHSRQVAYTHGNRSSSTVRYWLIHNFSQINFKCVDIFLLSISPSRNDLWRAYHCLIDKFITHSAKSGGQKSESYSDTLSRQQ